MNRRLFFRTPIIEDEKGWKLNSEYVMEKWEEPIIKKSIREICKKVHPKSVLEIGFGAGYTADEFQKQGVKKHVIIEAHPYFYEKAEKWAKDYLNVEVILGFWQDITLPEEFDLLYNDVFEKLDIPKCLKDEFNCKWYAEMFEEEDRKRGFKFEINGKIYYQPLTIN